MFLYGVRVEEQLIKQKIKSLKKKFLPDCRLNRNLKYF